ncbi:MAG TPA: addiction module protein [Verrucomicrobiae bacterium]|nr:addiction module protein [Verrucomicrobiae bacterium]
MSALEIQQMPLQEKLKLMEALWADLSRDDAEVESPAWHANALRETSERLARGEEKVLDWEQVKIELRKGKK